MIKSLLLPIPQVPGLAREEANLAAVDAAKRQLAAAERKERAERGENERAEAEERRRAKARFHSCFHEFYTVSCFTRQKEKEKKNKH